MSTATSSRITVPRIRVYGAGDLNRLNTFEFEGKMDTEIGDYGKPLHDLHKGSIALRDQATLFQAYLLSELGENLELSEEVKNAVFQLFDKRGYGNVTDDACDYNNGDSRLKKVKPTDRAVRWIIHPKQFRQTNNGWEALLEENSEIHNILVPKTGHVELTVDGAYRPDTGTPFSTVESRKEAEKSWTGRGFDPEFAEKAVSYFYSREEGNGTVAVGRWFSYAVGGRFDVYAGDGPDFRDSFIGSFLASRSPSGARHTHKKGTVVVEEKAYRALMETAEKLAGNLKSLKA